MALDFGAVLTPRYVEALWNGTVLTCKMATSAWVVAISLGLALAVVRMAPVPLVRWPVVVFVEFTRNVPLLVQMMFWYFAMPTLLPESWQAAINASDSEAVMATLALGVCVAGYYAEIFRAGIQAIPRTQYEAGRALGFGFLQTMLYFILPQSFRSTIPPAVNMTLVLFKATSIAAAIGAAELTSVGRTIENDTFRTFETFAVITVIYLVFTTFITLAGDRLERRYRL